MSKNSFRPFYGIVSVRVLTAAWLLFGLLAAVSMGGLAVPAFCAAPETTLHDLRWPHSHSDLPPDPDVIYGALSNGFRYVLMQNHQPADRVSMHLNLQAGSFHEEENQRGLAHFLEHLLFCGSEHFQPGDLIKYFQGIGMQFGPDANAHTGFYETVYDIHLPDGGRQSLDQGLLVIKDYAGGALLLQSEIDRERNVILAEKRKRDSASHRTFEASLAFQLPEARIAKRLPIGLETVIQNADRAKIKDFYDSWYRPENMILVLVGDFDADLAARLIADRFSGMRGRAPRRQIPAAGEICHSGIEPFYHFEEDAGNTEVSISIVEKKMHVPDSFDFQRRELIRTLADRMLQNRLDRLIGKPATPFTSASISSGTYLRHIGYAEIRSDCSPDKWQATLSLLEQNLRAALTFGFTPSELERVKKEYAAELDNALKRSATRDSKRLAREIMRALNDDTVFQSPSQKKERFGPVVSALKLHEVNSAFKTSWAADHRLLMVTGNARIAGDPVRSNQQILDVFKKSQTVEVAAFSDKADVVFPYLPEPQTEGLMVRRDRIAELGIETVDFDNGLRLNLKRTPFKSDQILFALTFGGGKYTEPLDKPGLAELAIPVLNESGFAKMVKDDLKRALAGKNTRVYFTIAEDYFGFHGEAVSSEVELLFQLLRAHLLDQGWRSDAHELALDRYRQKYQSLERTVEGALQLSGNRFLGGGDSRFGLPSQENFELNMLEDIRSWIESAMQNSRLELSVVGDFDTERVIAMARKYLGTLPAGAETADEHIRQRKIEFPKAQALEITIRTQIPKGLVKVAYPTADFWDIQRTRRLMILAEVFSEKLRKRIRERLGAAYSPYAYNRSSRVYDGYGVFQAVVQVNPEQVGRVITEVKKIAADLVQHGVSEEDLKRALSPVLTRIKDMARDNEYWLKSVLISSRKYPRQFDWSKSMQSDFASITAPELTTLAREYLDNRKAAVVVVKPEAAP